MGNLLVAPIVDKETHRGVTNEGLEYAVSSMQGWRVHMEDAHIMEGIIFAEKPVEENDNNPTRTNNASSDNDTGGKDDMADGNADGGAVKKAKTSAAAASTAASADDSSPTVNKIQLPGHSLFAVFDGHGGTFAAEFAGLNFTRVLCRQKAFMQYAHFVNSLAARDAMETVSEDDHKMTPQEKAQVNREGLEFLETALRDAFLDCDRELWREVSGYGNSHSVVPPRKQTQDKDGEMADDHEAAGSFDSGGEEWQSGTTATVVMITPQWILCANAGDSRSVYSKQGHCTIPLSYDHKPDDEAEERRIYDAGGCVRAGRVEGDLAVSRGLGDFRFKEDDLYQSMGAVPVSFSQYDDVSGRKKKNNASNIISPGDQKVSPMPDIIVQNRSPEHDEFVVVACDGIFDVQTNHECIALTAEIFREGESDCGLVCEEILDVCLEKGSKDNMTALVIKMPAQVIGQGGGVAERRRLRMEAEEKEKAT